MADLKILQVVGYKNSGKTTLIAAWTEMLSKQGKKVAVIKHHGHGGALQLPDEQADSVVVLEAGASSSLAYGAGYIQLHIQHQEMELARLLEMILWTQPDIIFVEGFKQANYPKVILLRQPEDFEPLSQLTEVAGVIAPMDTGLESHSVINRQDAQALQEWLQKWMEGERSEDV